MKPKYTDLYMDLAERISKMSYAKRLQVGSVIVKENTIISFGWNGMPSGWENVCETEVVETSEGFDGLTVNTKLVTKPEVLHSEMNALMKVAKSTESSNGSVMFCTHAPCMDCAKAIYQAGIQTLYYKNEYRSTAGLEFLVKSGVIVHKHDSSISV